MTLPNTYFENFPIEFKQINPSDFPEFEIENNNQKIIIEPNEEGYINEVFQEQIDLLHKNTVVVNAAVGQGKSTAIINTIKRYYDSHPDTIIFVASPFVTLVDQYCNDIHVKANIPEEQIYNYRSIGRSLADFRTKRIHVITANTLLGNPGEDAFTNGKNKRRYLNSLLEHCETNRLKVVFIYDEIHDAIANFREEYIFSLWKWRNVILKNYILSATFSEASKIVIEYLAELTNKKIQIIESKRIVFPSKQSSLHLHYSPAYRFKSNNPELFKVIERLINLDKQIDILSFSKKLAKQIINDADGIGKLLKEKFELNDCTSQLKDNQSEDDDTPTNRFDNSKCNVGTNFKTGVSIEKENHAFIIIMPSLSTRMQPINSSTSRRRSLRNKGEKFKNQYGIFSDGINTIIQALARQRIKGEIHIILPNPDNFDYESLNLAEFSENQKNAFKDFYENVKNNFNNDRNSNVKYIKLENQNEILFRFYTEKLYENVANEINFISSLDRSLLNPLRYPTFKLFKLNKGEKYLSSKHHIFGKDISAYLTYCAITNQFVNCKLSEVILKPILNFKMGKFQILLRRYYNIYFEDLIIFKNYFNFYHFYNSVREKFLRNFTLKLKNTDGLYENINQYNKIFETQLLRFCGFEYFGNNYNYFISRTDQNRDTTYSRSNYLLDCISVSRNVNLDEVQYLSEQKNKIKGYKNLELIRTLFIQKITHYTGRNLNYNYLPTLPTENLFSLTEKQLILDTINLLLENDVLLKNDVFNFKRNFFEVSGREKTNDKKIKSLYKMLLEDFFITQTLDRYPRHRFGNNTSTVKPIISIIDLATNNNTVSNTLVPDPLIEFAREEYGNFNNYQNILNNALAESESES